MPSETVTCRALAAGRWAATALAQPQPGAIAGGTSRGAFVRTASEQVLFLTEEPYRGPLSINLLDARNALQRLRPGMAVRLGAGCLDVHDARTVFDAAHADTWLAPPACRPALPPAERSAAAHALAAHLLPGAVESPFAVWLSAVSAAAPLPADLLRLRHALAACDVDAVVTFARDELLGRGRGLTPSGDDCVTGLLLALNRWPAELCPDASRHDLNAALTRAARELTTALSAALIECAAQGEADERLVNAVDGLMTGALAPDQCARQLQSYGASSGIDALAGMLAAVWTDADGR